MRNFLRYINVLVKEIGSFFFCGRMLSFFLVLSFFIYIYLEPIMKFSSVNRHPVSPWGILFLFSGLYFNLVILLGAIYLYSKVPFAERNQIYRIVRLGKRKWVLIQAMKIFFSSFLYVGTLFFISFLIMIPYQKFELDWGKVYYTLALTNAPEKADLMFDISYHLISRHSPLSLMLKSYFIISLIVSVLGFIMFLFSVFLSRIFAIVSATLLAIAPIILENLNMDFQKILVQIVPTEWVKIAKIGERNFIGVLSPDFNDIIFRLIMIIITLIIIICFTNRKMQFEWCGEE